jgi:imidazolonepropionase-like amidohydrolase
MAFDWPQILCLRYSYRLWSLPMKRMLAVLAFLSTLAFAQSPQLSPAVRTYVKYDQPTIALTHVRVIDGTGAPARDNQTILISAGKIQSVGEAAPPAGAQVIDLTGYSVIPGLVGMHDHIFYPTGGVPVYAELAYSAPKLYLGAGVTTIRTTGSLEPYADLQLKKQIDGGRTPGPKMYVTGPYLEGVGAFTVQMHELKDADDARRTVAYWADEGVNNYKAYMNITRAELSAAIDEAHKRGLRVTGHLCSIGFREAAALGIDDLEHGLVVDTEFTPTKQPDICPGQLAGRDSILKLDMNGPELQRTIKELVAHKVALTSTLPVFETSVPNRPPFDTAGAPPGPGRGPTYMSRVLDSMAEEPRRAYLTGRAQTGTQDPAPRTELFKRELQFEYAFAKAGGLLIAGLDPTGGGGVVPGFGDWREVELLVEAGFTPLEAITIQTFNGAQYLGDNSIGSIAAGKAADLVVIKGDPSKNITDIEKVETVFKDGIGYDSQRLFDAAKGRVGLQ